MRSTQVTMIGLWIQESTSTRIFLLACELLRTSVTTLETPEAMEHVRQRRDDGVDGQPQSLRATQRHGLAGRGDVALQGCRSVSEGEVLKR